MVRTWRRGRLWLFVYDFNALYWERHATWWALRVGPFKLQWSR